MALACILLRLREKQGIHVEAVHVNHGLRGPASDGDETFVRDFCASHSLPLRVFRADPGDEHSELWAREARYGFFREAMAESGADALVTAHHRGDQAETILLHLMRGAGLDGLRGMRRDSCQGGIRIIRPLLECSHEELQALLLKSGQDWREDDSNHEDTYLRNRIRHTILPAMEAMLPGSTRHIAACAARLDTDGEALDRMAEAALRRGGESYLSLDDLAELEEAVLRRVLRSFYERFAGVRAERSLDDAHTQALSALIRATPGTRLQLPGNVTAYRAFRYLHLLGKTKAVPSPIPLTDGCRFSDIVFHFLPADRPGDGKTCQAIPASLAGSLTVRTRASGDIIRPFGQTGAQSLKSYLIDRKIDQPFRDQIPLLCVEKEVLVVCGVGAGGVPDFAGDGEHILVSWSGEMPWLTDQTKRRTN
ncbi:MAG: tRNA lysidine(34) synthetase TilS [Clostridia bacterium]|nr:tRNA lysidine(34) synthetase TilS [Clostridia bacterium]